MVDILWMQFSLSIRHSNHHHTMTITRPTIEEIVEETSSYFGVAEQDIQGRSRMKRPLEARQVAMFLADEMTHATLREIGENIGNRDHTTVINAKQKIQDLTDTDEGLRSDLTELRERIEETVKNRQEQAREQAERFPDNEIQQVGEQKEQIPAQQQGKPEAKSRLELQQEIEELKRMVLEHNNRVCQLENALSRIAEAFPPKLFAQNGETE